MWRTSTAGCCLLRRHGRWRCAACSCRCRCRCRCKGLPQLLRPSLRPGLPLGRPRCCAVGAGALRCRLIGLAAATPPLTPASCLPGPGPGSQLPAPAQLQSRHWFTLPPYPPAPASPTQAGRYPASVPADPGAAAAAAARGLRRQPGRQLQPAQALCRGRGQGRVARAVALGAAPAAVRQQLAGQDAACLGALRGHAEPGGRPAF
jgi:hypothetical protein